jgi:hypothetical protein
VKKDLHRKAESNRRGKSNFASAGRRGGASGKLVLCAGGGAQISGGGARIGACRDRFCGWRGWASAGAAARVERGEGAPAGGERDVGAYLNLAGHRGDLVG